MIFQDYLEIPVITFRIHKSIHEIATSDWNSFHQKQAPENIFMSRVWFEEFWKNFSSSETFIFALYRNERLISFVPLAQRRKWVLFKEIEFFHNAHSFYSEILGESAEEITLLIRHLKKHFGFFSRFIWPKVFAESVTAQALLKSCHGYKICGESPYISVALNLEKYKETLSKNARHQINQSWENLRKDFKVTHHIYEFLDQKIGEDLFLVDHKAWQGQEGTGISCGDFRRFYSSILTKFGENKNLRITILYLDSKPVSYLIGIVQQDVLWLLKMGFLPEFQKYNVGHLTNMTLLEEAFTNSHFSRIEHVGLELTQFKRRYTSKTNVFYTFEDYACPVFYHLKAFWKARFQK